MTASENFQPAHRPYSPILNPKPFLALQYVSERKVMYANVPPGVFSSAGFTGKFTLLSYPAPPTSFPSPSSAIATANPSPQLQLDTSDSASETSSAASSTPLSSTPAPLPDISTPSPLPVAAIGGGVVGGIIVIALVLAAYLFRRRKWQSSRQVVVVDAPEMHACLDAQGLKHTTVRRQSSISSVHGSYNVGVTSDVVQLPLRCDAITGAGASEPDINTTVPSSFPMDSPRTIGSRLMPLPPSVSAASASILFLGGQPSPTLPGSFTPTSTASPQLSPTRPTEQSGPPGRGKGLLVPLPARIAPRCGVEQQVAGSMRRPSGEMSGNDEAPAEVEQVVDVKPSLCPGLRGPQDSC